jgi:glutathione S-transferase
MSQPQPQPQPQPNSQPLTLISHHLCPYVQRAAISLVEKGVPFRRSYIDLADKPAWFHAISPLGKVPVLKAGETAIFESNVILEYLEDTLSHPLHPGDPLARARHRSWIEYGSAILQDIAGLYNSPDAASFAAATARLAGRFERLEGELGEGPWFAGKAFSLVDAVYGPIFRYWESFDAIGDFGILAGKPRLAAWRARLARRPSVCQAVTADYRVRLDAFLRARGSHISGLMSAEVTALAGL